MIVYDLTCGNEHLFETWFRDSAAYDQQRKARKVVCPVCGDKEVSKALMAPALAGKRGEAKAGKGQAWQKAAEMMQALRHVRDHVEQNCDYVGSEFAEEARKIHYGETEHRDIYGEATDEESSELKEEGVEFRRIPWVPRHDG